MTSGATRRRAFAVALLVACSGCRTPAAAPVPEPLHPDALMIVPGFGYTRAGARAIRVAADSLAARGIAVYVPDYVRRGGLAESRAALLEFYRAHGLDRYERLHVFAFIAGAWTINPAINTGALPNLASVIYDRSPMQERAPRVAVDWFGFGLWLVMGPVIFDVARTPYTPIEREGVKVGLLVETKPTSFIRRFAGTAKGYGPLSFECATLGQRYDDCAFIALSHDELYLQFPAIVPAIVAFVRTGRFPDDADRTPPAESPLP